MRPQPGDAFAWIDTAAGPALVCRPLERVAPHLFTTRAWRLGSARSPVEVDAAWAEVAAALSVDAASLVRVHQVHGAAAALGRAGGWAGGALPDADIIMSDDPSVALAIQTADCVPILMADARTGAVAAAHAGWRGLAARVPDAAVTAMIERFHSRPADLVAAIGPSISAANYEVGADVRARFEAAAFGPDRLARWFPTLTRQGHWLFDGWRSARDQLADAGVRADRIHVAGLCTSAHADLFCSYRRDGKGSGRMAAVIKVN